MISSPRHALFYELVRIVCMRIEEATDDIIQIVSQHYVYSRV